MVELDGFVRTAICDTIVAGLRHDDVELEAALVRDCLSEGTGGSHGGRSLVYQVPIGALSCPGALPQQYLNERGEYR